MIDPKKLKKGDMLYNGPVIYKVTNNNTEKGEIDLFSYSVDLHDQKVIPRGPYGWDYAKLPRPFMNAVPLDDDGRQGYIIGIFEREEY